MVKILQWQQFINTTIRIHQCQNGIMLYNHNSCSSETQGTIVYFIAMRLYQKQNATLSYNRNSHSSSTKNITMLYNHNSCSSDKMRQCYTLSQYSFIRNSIPQCHTITVRIHQKRYSVIANGATYLRKTVIVTIFTSSTVKMSST